MGRPVRNKALEARMNRAAELTVENATKGGRKPKKSFKFTIKSNEDFSHNETIHKIFKYSFLAVKEKFFKVSVEPGIYIINTNVMWKEKEIRPNTTTSKKFDFHKFNIETIMVVEDKANSKGYRVIQKNAIATLSCSNNQKSIFSGCRDESE